MTYDELLASIERMTNHDAIFIKDSLRVAAYYIGYELLKKCVFTVQEQVLWNGVIGPTIQVIEKELG